MAERYTRLSSLPENQYTIGSPILIAAGALLKDNQTGKALAQIKFRSISEKQIKAVKISIAAFDVSGKELDGVAEYQYLDLIVARTAEFGHKQAVTLPDAVTRSIEVKCTDVFFTDGAVWTAAPDAVWTSLPTQKTVTAQLGNLAAQYQRDTTPKSKFIPIEHENLWFCSCGAINHSEESKCHNCRHSKGALFAALDIDALRQRDAEYNAAETEKAEKQAAADKVQRAKTTKFAIITAAVIALVVSALLVTTKVIIPNGKYNDAVTLMDSGKYEEAIAIFEAMEGYKDSINRIDECKTAILDNKYNDAVVMMDAGEYENAIAAFDVLNGYKDSTTKIEECEVAILDKKYNTAITLMNTGKIIEAYEALISLEGYKDSTEKANSIYGKYQTERLKNAQAGDCVLFGVYEQDNNFSNGKEDIEWLVLEVKDGIALVISKYTLDYQPYNSTNTKVTWETCTLREWLNDVFLHTAFSDRTQSMIATVTVSADKNPNFTTDAGNATQDKVFLLSVNEVNKYFQSDNARCCKATAYVKACSEGKISYPARALDNRSWWLRSPGSSLNEAAFVLFDGAISNTYVKYFELWGDVRPAMWIDLNGLY